MSPAAGALTKALTDASGIATATITNANPINNCAATVTWTGTTATTADTDAVTAGTQAGVLARTLTWKTPVATTVLSDPSANVQALLGSSNKITWTVLDQFSNPVVGKTVTFSMSGANAPTVGLASQVTDAKGQVSYSWTDAAAAAADTDTVSIATVGADLSGTYGSVTVTYKSALSVVGSIATYYGTTAASATTLVSTSAIGGAAGKAISGNDQLDLTGVIATAADPGAVFVKFSPLTSALAAVSGLPMTVSVTGPAKILDTAGYLVTSRVVYASTTFTVVGLGTGVATITASVGGKTSSASVNFVNAKGDARVLSAVESGGTITATVKDFYGNVVSGVTVTAALTGTGRLANGATSGTFVTNTDGTVAIDVTGAGTVTVSLDATDYPKASYLKDAGNTTGSVSTPGSPAGVRSVAVTTTGKANVAADAANAASDAALEAIDAATAATDAANLAAEAADAATMAAQDAKDAADAATAAVEKLAQDVATMIDALKAQLATLANVVAKIAKKVKA